MEGGGWRGRLFKRDDSPQVPQHANTHIVMVQLPPSHGVLRSFFWYVHPLKLLQHILVVGCIHWLASFLYIMQVDHALLVKNCDGENLQFWFCLTYFLWFQPPFRRPLTALLLCFRIIGIHLGLINRDHIVKPIFQLFFPKRTDVDAYWFLCWREQLWNPMRTRMKHV